MKSFFREQLQKFRIIKKNIYIENLKRRGFHMGETSSILEPFFLDSQHCFLITIGEGCTLAPNVRLIAHDASSKAYVGFTRIGKITIHDNCFIGDSAIVLPNVSIGPNSIVGAGSLVNKDIPENVVAVGNPAKVICSMDNYIKKLKASSEKKGVYGDEYLMGNITGERMNEVLTALDNDEGFIV